MISVIAGIINAIARFTKRFVFVRSLLASSNRSSSCFSVENARMTGIPVRISREIRFRRSIFFCSTLNFGMTNANSTTITAATIAVPRTMIQLKYELVFMTFIMPPTARNGAYSTIRNISDVTSCTC